MGTLSPHWGARVLRRTRLWALFVQAAFKFDSMPRSDTKRIAWLYYINLSPLDKFAIVRDTVTHPKYVFYSISVLIFSVLHRLQPKHFSAAMASVYQCSVIKFVLIHRQYFHIFFYSYLQSTKILSVWAIINFSFRPFSFRRDYYAVRGNMISSKLLSSVTCRVWSENIVWLYY